MVCTTEQLNDCQKLLARLYGKPDLEPMHRNATGSSEQDKETGLEMKEKFGDFFAVDLRFMAFIERRFEKHSSKLKLD